MAADHLFELDADVLALATASSRAIPTTSPPRVHGGFVICADGAVTRFDPPTGLEGAARRPARAGPHRRGARRAARAGADGGRGLQRRARARC